jgi:hypothetical protein
MREPCFDAYQSLGEHYASIRRWSPAFLEAFEFESVPASASLMRAIAVLREMNRSGASTLPKPVPTGFVRQRPAPCRSPSKQTSSASSPAAGPCWTNGWPRSMRAPATGCFRT